MNNIERAFFCRNISIVTLVVLLLWASQFLFFLVPERNELLSEYGDVEKIQLIHKKGDVIGYKIYINDRSFVLSWLDFHLTDGQIDSIKRQTKLNVLYHQNCSYVCKRYVYEISSDEKNILSYEFFKSNYESDRNQKTQVIPYVLVIITLGIIFLHFYAKNLKARSESQ